MRMSDRLGAEFEAQLFTAENDLVEGSFLCGIRLSAGEEKEPCTVTPRNVCPPA